MRTMSLAFTAMVAVWVAAPAIAQNLPSDAHCHVLARQRGAGESEGSRIHERFIRDCVSGKIAAEEPPHVPGAVREMRAVSSDMCHVIARRRGSGEGAGWRIHERYISDCVAGKISTTDAKRIENSMRELRKRSSEECHALAAQRGSLDAAGKGTHDKFISDCMAGKVS
jgi:hypothetical protein